MSSGRSPAGVANASDPSWRGLYRAGSVSAVLYVVFTVAAIVLSSIVARPPLSGGAATLEFIAENRTATHWNRSCGCGPTSSPWSSS